MPSVGMRRTTRVFGVVKGVDGARVLRSGRRLWPDSGDGKLRRSNYGDDWYHPVIKKNDGNGAVGPKCKPNCWAHVEVKFKPEEKEESEVHGNEREIKLCKKVEEVKEELHGVDRMFGIVYTRKRKRNGDAKTKLLKDKMYGIRFCRRQRAKRSEKMVPVSVFGVGLESFCSVRSSGFLACFLTSVLGYMKKARVELHELSSFILSQQMSGVFSSCGIRFSWDPPIDSTAMCKIFGAMQSIPLFSLDFLAVPSCFMYIHRSMLFRLKCLPFVPVNSSVTEEDSSDEDLEYVFESKTRVPVVDITVKRVGLHPSVRVSKLAARNVQHRNSLNARTIQKRRSSLRRRAKNPSLISALKASVYLVSDFTSSSKSSTSFTSAVSKNKLWSSIRSSSIVSIKESTSSMDQLMQDSDSSCCCASILIMESDRCYRAEGADVVLEMSDSKEWHLVVKKDGEARYTHKAQKIMRPSLCNRFTHAILWSAEDSWKLEFPNRQDWLNFKDLYKKCSERNDQASIAKVIPIPGVLKASGYGDGNTVPFCRPDAYISVNVDEVSRALSKRTANYDMDSEDEEWLKFNNDLFTKNELHEHVSEDDFELMIDAFEKAYFCSPDDFSNEEAAVNLCLDMGRREVVLAVYNHWMKKRKQKRSALLSVFQGRQAKKPPLIPKPALHKRRSFKRQASQPGRGKPTILLPAVVTQQDALEEQNAMLLVEEAKASTKRSVEAAVLKRQRVQLLMQNADLATYKATMAMRIAEAAQVADAADAVADHYLD